MFSHKIFFSVLFILVLCFELFSSEGELKVYFFSGNHEGNGHIDGASCLVIAPNGVKLLIDGGESGTRGGKILTDWFKYLGIEHIDYALITHNHTDHFGGILDIVNSIAIDTFILYDTHILSKKLEGRTRKIMEPGDTLYLSRCVYTVCYAANGKLTDGWTNSKKIDLYENLKSIAIVLNYSYFQMYVGGDLSGYSPDQESRIAPYIGEVEVLSTNHHGSTTSSNENFIMTLFPEVIYISYSSRVPVEDRPLFTLTRAGDIFYSKTLKARIPRQALIGTINENIGSLIVTVPYEDADTFFVETTSGFKNYYLMHETPDKKSIP